jgi:hypothetical protein
LNYSSSTGKKQLGTQLYYLDTPNKLDSPTDNAGFSTRQSYVAKSRACEVLGPLFTDLTNQSRYLLNSVDMRVKLARHSDAFALMAFEDDAKDSQLHLEEAILYVQKVNLSTSTQLALETMLRTHNALYNMQRTELKSFTVAKGDTTFTREHISLGLSPNYAIVGLVSTEAMQGSLRKNPFNFPHYNLKRISMNVDGEQIPSNAINCDFEHGLFLEGYQSLLEVVGKWRTDNAMMISPLDYVGGFTMYGFQLAPELVDGAFSLVRNTNIRLDVKFSKALPENVTVLVWFSYDSVLEINANREIAYNFSL